MIERATSPQVASVPADLRIVENVRGDLSEPARGRRPTVRLALATSVFLAAGYLGRATIIDGHGLSLIWPAIGVAGLWIGSGDRRTWPTDVAALSAATLLVTMTTGADLPRALVLLSTNLVQVAVFVGLVRRWAPALWGFGGTEPLTRFADLARLALAAGVSGIAGLAVGISGVLITLGSTHSALFAVWWGRNTVALIVITCFGLLVGHPLLTAGSIRGALRVVAKSLVPAGWRRTLESLGLLTLTVGLALLVFVDNTAQPLAFLLLSMSVWGGIRFAPVAVTVHGVLMGGVGVAFTLAGQGPFAAIDSLYYRALSAQAFVAMTVLTGLALAFSRDERDSAFRDLGLARRAADERAQLLDAVLESMHEGIVVIEEGGRVLVRNSAGRALIGLSGTPADRIQPAATYGLFHGNGFPLRDDELPGVRALDGETVAAQDFHVRAASVPLGRVVSISAQPLVGGGPRRAMVNVRDVTVERQHRDALASFAGVVAHDLFNPISLVDGWAEALDDEFSAGPVSPAVGLPMVARINDAAAHMRNFIADLMAYTVARDQSLRSEQVDLTATIRGLARLRASRENPAVIAVDDDLVAWADPGLMRQLFDNLLGNAVKYVAPGVRPAVAVTGGLRDGRLQIRVTDNGIGVPEDQREQIFESFHRARTDYHGTGLGLAICRRIADRHGGTIHAETGPGGIGTAFVLDVPAAVDQVPVSEPSGLPVLAPLRA